MVQYEATHTITCDGRQDSDYQYPMYHDFGSTCFNPICCHYFQVLTLLKARAGISRSVDCASCHIVCSESRCALIKDVGSDVHKRSYRPESVSFYLQTLYIDLLVRCFLCTQLLQFLIY